MVRDILQALLLHTEGHHHGPVKMQRKISLIQQLLLEGLFFQESFCHKGSVQLPMAHIKEAEVLIICEINIIVFTL